MKIVNALKRRLIRHKQLLDSYADEKNIFIYQMGKVGSTTLENSIKNAIHIHAFYNKNYTCPVRLKGLAKFGLKHVIYRAEQEILAFLLREIFKRRKRTKIITLVRNPMARNISMFFHDIDAYLFLAHTNCLNTRKMALATRNQNLDLLSDVFNQDFEHQYPLEWFDKEFKPMTGIDIYATDFDQAQGYSIINKNNIEVMCLRTDKIKDCVGELGDFVGCDIELSLDNQADSKWYADIYREFKDNYKLPIKMQNKIKNSQFYTHFFSE